MAFSSQSCLEVRFLMGSRSCSNKVLQTPKLNICFSCKLFLTALCCHKINWLEQLRDFIPDTTLNWINCTRLDDVSYLNKYSIVFCEKGAKKLDVHAPKIGSATCLSPRFLSQLYNRPSRIATFWPCCAWHLSGSWWWIVLVCHHVVDLIISLHFHHCKINRLRRRAFLNTIPCLYQMAVPWAIVFPGCDDTVEPSITDTIGTQLFVRYSGGVPNSGASGIFLVGLVCVIRLLSPWIH